MGPAGASPPSLCSSQACLFAELPISNREGPLRGHLLKHLEVLVEGSPGAVRPAGLCRNLWRLAMWPMRLVLAGF